MVCGLLRPIHLVDENPYVHRCHFFYFAVFLINSSHVGVSLPSRITMKDESTPYWGYASIVCPVFGGVNKHRFVVFQHLVDEKRAVAQL